MAADVDERLVSSLDGRLLQAAVPGPFESALEPLTEPSRPFTHASTDLLGSPRDETIGLTCCAGTAPRLRTARS